MTGVPSQAEKAPSKEDHITTHFGSKHQNSGSDDYKTVLRAKEEGLFPKEDSIPS